MTKGTPNAPPKPKSATVAKPAPRKLPTTNVASVAAKPEAPPPNVKRIATSLVLDVPKAQPKTVPAVEIGGTDKDELAGQQDAAKETAEGDEEAAPAEPEEPDNTVTYAEYMASQGGSKKQETASQVQEKPKIEAMFEVNKVKKVRKKKVKKVQTLQLAFKFDAQEDAAPKRDQNRGGDRGGDRGGNRGGDRGGNRGGDRGDRRGGNNRGGRGGRGGGRGGKGGNRQGGNRQSGNRGANFAAPNDSAFPTLA